MSLVIMSAMLAVALAGHAHHVTGGRAFSVVPAPSYTLTSNVTNLATPHEVALISWTGVDKAASGDWIAVGCLPANSYFYWVYVSGSKGRTTSRTRGSLPPH